MLIAFLVNVFGAKYLVQINKICIYWTSASVIIVIITVLVMSDDRRNTEFVFAHFDASASGWPSGWSWFVGLLQAACKFMPFPLPESIVKFSVDTLTGYGMVAAMCEEVQMPEREAPQAMVLSVAAAGVTGVIYLIHILLILPDVSLLLSVANG
jgi:amino acid transporter